MHHGDIVVFIDYFTKVSPGGKGGKMRGGGGGGGGVGLNRVRTKVIECIVVLPPPPGHPPAHSHQRLEWLDSGHCQVCAQLD